MKKILGLLALILVFSNCDDGDMTIETIDFQDVQAASCGEIIYKLNGNEALYMKIPTAANAFANEITPTDEPRIITIGSSVNVTYRAYNGNVTAANLCNSPAPISPTATTEWTASAGTIEISTIAVYSTPDAVTGATKILKYLHNIVFKNIVFNKPEGTQVYETFPFGEYATTATTLPLTFNPDNVAVCPSNQLLYNAGSNDIEAIYIQNFDSNLLNTSNLGTPKTALISATSNKLVYRLFETALTTTNQEYFCGSSLPSTPTVTQEWTAQNGVADTSGIIEVVTTTNGSGFLHTITLKAVTFQKGNSTFYLGNSIVIGNLLTTN
ncbi:hypothetical protein G4D82_07630 [Flavobacterium sp. CYK-4]|uniref:hypothetical protein n=1 Tax=Flavobacterium lotistagni TaxID=2709660 RepID=UPI0014097471|nr:hypothetical protein [Flavobacterium lotistagni]NHM07088.1 hypothetical protein [Flavobacterium lotistagni]